MMIHFTIRAYLYGRILPLSVFFAEIESLLEPFKFYKSSMVNGVTERKMSKRIIPICIKILRRSRPYSPEHGYNYDYYTVLSCLELARKWVYLSNQIAVCKNIINDFCLKEKESGKLEVRLRFSLPTICHRYILLSNSINL